MTMEPNRCKAQAMCHRDVPLRKGVLLTAMHANHRKDSLGYRRERWIGFCDLPGSCKEERARLSDSQEPGERQRVRFLNTVPPPKKGTFLKHVPNAFEVLVCNVQGNGRHQFFIGNQ